MSVAFAIPATTLVLKRLLEKAVSASFPGGFAAVTKGIRCGGGAP